MRHGFFPGRSCHCVVWHTCQRFLWYHQSPEVETISCRRMNHIMIFVSFNFRSTYRTPCLYEICKCYNFPSIHVLKYHFLFMRRSFPVLNLLNINTFYFIHLNKHRIFSITSFFAKQRLQSVIWEYCKLEQPKWSRRIQAMRKGDELLINIFLVFFFVWLRAYITCPVIKRGLATYIVIDRQCAR